MYTPKTSAHSHIMPKLTQERRAAMHAWYDGAITSMKDEFYGWYPEGNVSTDTVSAEHAGFSDRIASISNELGYRKWYELGSAIGLTLEGEQPSDLLNLDARLDSANTTLWKKIGKSLEKIDEWYPEGAVVDYKKAHTNSCENLNVLAKKFGFESWQTLLTSCGYEVVNTYSGKGGRPQIIDYGGIINSLKERYADSPAASIGQLKRDNPEIPWKSLSNNSKREFGTTLTAHLKETGILEGEIKPSFTEEEFRETISRLIEKYAPLPNKPKSLSELYQLEPLEKPCLECYRTKAAQVLGETLAAHLLSNGVLEKGRVRKQGATEEECREIVDAFLDKYRDLGSVRDVDSFKQANEPYALNAKAVNSYIRKTYGRTVLQFLTARGIISKAARDDSKPRPKRETVQAFEVAHPLVMPEELRGGRDDVEIVECESTLRAFLDDPLSANYGMLHPGDSIALNVYDDSLTHADFCGYDLGRIPFSLFSELRLDRLTGHPADYGMINESVYAQIVSTSGAPKSNSAKIRVWYAIDTAKRNIKNGILLSQDGKTALDIMEHRNTLTIPKGVEVVAEGAFLCEPFTKVTMPDTLRVIETRAFSLCGARSYTIPASVEKIAPGAFSFRFANSDDLEYTAYSSVQGPVKIEVANNNERYRSVKGSLVEVDGDQVTLLSLHYEGAPKRSNYSIYDMPRMKLVVPDGVTRLASHCVSAVNCGEYDVKLPESLTTIDEDAFVTERRYGHTHMMIKKVNIPAGLTDVHHSFWENVVEDIPFAYDQDWQPLAKLKLFARVTVDKDNPRYSVRHGFLHDTYLAAEQSSPRGVTISDAHKRPSKDETDRIFAVLLHDRPPLANPLTIDIPVRIELPNSSSLQRECMRSWPILQEGDVLTVSIDPQEHEAIAAIFGNPLGTLTSQAEDNPLAAHPAYAGIRDDAARNIGLTDLDQHTYTNEETGETISYTFAFLAEDDDSARSEIEAILDDGNAVTDDPASDDPELSLRAQYLTYANENVEVPEGEPGIESVIDRYRDMKGVGQPIVIVDNLLQNPLANTAYAANGTLKLTFDA